LLWPIPCSAGLPRWSTTFISSHRASAPAARPSPTPGGAALPARDGRRQSATVPPGGDVLLPRPNRPDVGRRRRPGRTLRRGVGAAGSPLRPAGRRHRSNSHEEQRDGGTDGSVRQQRATGSVPGRPTVPNRVAVAAPPPGGSELGPRAVVPTRSAERLRRGTPPCGRRLERSVSLDAPRTGWLCVPGRVVDPVAHSASRTLSDGAAARVARYVG
jgi:hypothetical protein